MWAFITLSLLGFVTLFVGAFNLKKALLPIVVSGLMVAFVLNINEWGLDGSWFNSMLLFDNYALAFSNLMITITALLMLLASFHFRNESSSIGDIYALLLFSLTGGIIMVSFSNMIMLFVGIEILSIALYILAGSRRLLLASNEAALKYFLMGAFASGFLLFGIALIFGVTNSFDLNDILNFVAMSNSDNPLLSIGILLILVGLAFKVGAVPFHFWTPDVYQGAPIFITTFMSTVIKIAGVAAFYRLFNLCFSGVESTWYSVLWIICAATMLVGNILALKQTSAKRLYAFSGVANAGYLLIPILALNEVSASAIFYYTASYSVASILIFGVIMALAESDNDLEIEKFRGLFRRNKLLGFALIFGTLSLAGIPPLAGFLGKFTLFQCALESGLVNIVIIAVVASLIGVYYYFKPMIAAFDTKLTNENEVIETDAVFSAVMLIGIALTLLLTLLANTFTAFI